VSDRLLNKLGTQRFGIRRIPLTLWKIYRWMVKQTSLKSGLVTTERWMMIRTT